MSRSFTLLVVMLMPLVSASTGLAAKQSRPESSVRQQPAVSAIAPPSVEYVIGPEDVLGVVFWREPEMSGDVTVRPDGRITIPVVGELQASGRKPEVLQAEIAAAAGKYISSVNVVVVVRAINSRKIFVTGRVTTPGAYPLMQPLTVMQAIALAGGLTEFADPKGIVILRMENGKSRSVQFNYQDIARGKSLDQNVLLQPGDTVVVP